MIDASAPWVLLRGLARDARHWGTLPAMLARQFPGARVDCMDLAGNGTRHAEASASSIAGYANDVVRRVNDKRVNVLAISMGAMVAIEWARTAPGQVASLVLLNTSLRPFNPWWRRLNLAQVPMLAAALVGGDPLRRERSILHATSHRAPDEALVERWAAWARATPVSRSNALRQLRAAARYRVDDKPDVAMLFLASRRDRLVHPSCSRTIANAWHCQVHEHASAGHDLPLDDPAWVVERIAAWQAP